MDKAVLVIDMPKSCKECKIRFDDEYSNWCSYDNPEPDGVFKYVQNGTKPDWCPLRKIPEKFNEDNSTHGFRNRYKDGWDNCIDELIEKQT